MNETPSPHQFTSTFKQYARTTLALSICMTSRPSPAAIASKQDSNEMPADVLTTHCSPMADVAPLARKQRACQRERASDDSAPPHEHEGSGLCNEDSAIDSVITPGLRTTHGDGHGFHVHWRIKHDRLFIRNLGARARLPTLGLLKIRTIATCKDFHFSRAVGPIKFQAQS
jgi:hypothetical protein